MEMVAPMLEKENGVTRNWRVDAEISLCLKGWSLEVSPKLSDFILVTLISRGPIKPAEI